MSDPDRMPHGADIEELLVEHMHRDMARPQWWRTFKGRVAIAGAGLLVVSSAVAGVVLIESRQVSETVVVHCLETASRNLDGTLSGSAVSIAAPNGVIPIGDAEAVCRQMWESGAITSTDPLDPAPAPGEAPEAFTNCVTTDGAAAVVPGRIECSALGLHPRQAESD